MTHAEVNPEANHPLVARVLEPGALDLVVALHRELAAERHELLAARRERQARWDAGETPAYLPESEHPQAHGDWRVDPLPKDLLTRRVEITGPSADAKMVINMLSRTEEGHRADAAMIDFDDSLKPSWSNVLNGHWNIKQAAEGGLHHAKQDRHGKVLKEYRLDADDMPLIMVRIRGLHLRESNVEVAGEAVPASIIDFGLCMYHTAKTLVERGRTPKYYIPKVEHYLEARWYDRLFTLTEEYLGLPVGTVKATFLIETLPAAFQMQEILYEVRRHAAGLNGGRWDKIFSDIKCLRRHPDRILADRGSIDMTRPWMANYARLLVKVAHRRGAFGMGGMAAFTPGRTPELREEQTRKVVADKEFEASIGHDGCWVSHPYFIQHALRPFVEKMRDATNQLHVDPDIGLRPDLLPEGGGPRTLAGLRKNVRVGIAYMKGWNDDVGAVAWDNLMEDLATLEISRTQVWQWLHHGVQLDDGTAVTHRLLDRLFEDELKGILSELQGTDDEQLALYHRAAADARHLFTEDAMRSFLTCASERVGDESYNAGLRRDGGCAR